MIRPLFMPPLPACLAEKGFNSSKEIIEGKLGYFDVLTDNPDEDVVLDRLGSKYYLSDLRFLAALALAEGNVTLDKFTDEKVNDPKLVNLRRKVRATPVRELSLGARVTVKMKDGTQYQGFKARPKGSPEDPLSLEEIKTKFREASKLTIPGKNIGLLIDKIGVLEKLTDIEEIITLTRPETKTEM